MRGREYGALEKAKNLKRKLPQFITSTAAEEKGILVNHINTIPREGL